MNPAVPAFKSTLCSFCLITLPVKMPQSGKDAFVELSCQPIIREPLNHQEGVHHHLYLLPEPIRQETVATLWELHVCLCLGPQRARSVFVTRGHQLQ